MVVYVEVAFFENFLIDGSLLWLALIAAKEKVRFFRLMLAAVIGALFALFFPLYSYPVGWEFALKLAVGFLLPYIAISEKGVGRYAMSVGLFLVFSCCFAGAVTAFSGFFVLQTASDNVGAVFAVGSVVILASVCLIKRLYKRRLLRTFIFPCRIKLGEKEFLVDGFLDSGNRLHANGKPVGFITPDVVYELIGETFIEEETTVLTVAGMKKIRIFQADVLEIYFEKTVHRIENIYLSPSTQILGREYKLLFGAWAMK